MRGHRRRRKYLEFCKSKICEIRKSLIFESFLYQSGLSYGKVERFVSGSYEAVRQWYHALSEFFEPREVERQVVAVDETKMKVDGEQVYVWAAVDVETFEILHVDVSPGRSSLDALLFLRTVMSRCRGKPLVKVDPGPWYNWALDLLDCDYEKETFGERSLSESVFSLFKYRTLLFWKEFPYRSSVKSTQRWLRSYSALHNEVVLS